MTARKPAAHVNALEEVAKAIRRAAQRAGLDRKRGGLERWHRVEG